MCFVYRRKALVSLRVYDTSFNGLIYEGIFTNMFFPIYPKLIKYPESINFRIFGP
jgi:hypothetical protein